VQTRARPEPRPEALGEARRLTTGSRKDEGSEPGNPQGGKVRKRPGQRSGNLAQEWKAARGLCRAEIDRGYGLTSARLEPMASYYHGVARRKAPGSVRMKAAYQGLRKEERYVSAWRQRSGSWRRRGRRPGALSEPYQTGVACRPQHAWSRWPVTTTARPDAKALGSARMKALDRGIREEERLRAPGGSGRGPGAGEDGGQGALSGPNRQG
jgi:hypothetical protein